MEAPPTMAASQLALRQFLENHRIGGKTDARPVTATGVKGGKYSIPDEKYPEFLTLLYNYLSRDAGRPLNIVERPLRAGPKPLVIDLDFTYKKDRSFNHPFNENHIQAFLEKLVEGLNLFFDLSVYESLRFFVSLRPQGYEKDGAIKDGVHIQCPELVLSFEKQGVLRKWMLNQDAVNVCFKDTGFLDKPEKAYDESCTRDQGWFFYKESKPDKPAYDLDTVAIYTPDTDSWTNDFLGNYDDRELMELLSVRYNLDEDDNTVREEVRQMYDHLASYTPPPPPADVKPTPDLEGTPANILVQELDEITNKAPDTSAEDLELVKRMVRECLSPERADGYDTWKRVGWCLHNISPTEEMFQLFLEFSAKSSKSSGNDLAKLRREWELGMRKEGDGRTLTIRSLRYWAKEDNPAAFYAIVEKDLVDYVLHHVAPTHNHVARLMKRMFQDDYRCSIETRSISWFEFSPELHMWKRINQGVELRNKISLEVADMVAEARNRFKRDPEYNKLEAYASSSKSLDALGATLKELLEKRGTLRTENKIDESIKVDAEIRDTEAAIDLLNKKQDLARADVREKRLAELTDLEYRLYNSGFKDSVMKECQGLFYEEGFERKLNSNQFRIGCANGVLHLNRIKPSPDGTKMLPYSKAEGNSYDFFEPGRPEDYITFQAGSNKPEHEPLDYYPYDPTDPAQIELDDFFKKLFPQPELREWMDKKLLPSCLEGKNREQCYYTFQGVGGNGKSKLIELMIMTLGDYQSSLASTALTRKRPESGAANPDIISIKNKRFIYMQEPDDHEALNTSRMKQFSGEDAVEARALFSDQERFKITGKLFMMCNNLPPINSMDRGTWRRVRLIPFESKFVSPGDKELGMPNVFLKDNNLDRKLQKWRAPFFSRLVHNYITYYAITDNGTLEPAPEVVMQQSLKYRETFDTYAKFRYGRMRVDRDSDEQSTVADIWRAYRYWFEATGGGGKRLTQQELTRRLEDEFGKPSQGKYYRGVVVFNTEEDVEEYDNLKKSASAEEEEGDDAGEVEE